MTVCFTGHRHLNNVDKEELSKRIMKEIERLYDMGARTFIAGGALGFDMLCETCVIAFRRLKGDVKLILALPCREQDKNWSEVEKLCLYNIKVMADKVIYVSESYSSDCMFKRNRYMVDNSDVLICFKDGRLKGGTYYTMKYALDNNKKIINLYEK